MFGLFVCYQIIDRWIKKNMKSFSLNIEFNEFLIKFCKQKLNNDPKYHQLIFDECTRLMLRLRSIPVPVICQVDGK